MNGDDGYVDGGGGGSVWWELNVSEATNVNPALPQNLPAGHRPRKNGYRAYMISNGRDKYTEHQAGDQVGGSSTPLPANDPLITGQGSGYFVVIIDDASTIQRIEVDASNRMRIYVPVNQVPPGQNGPRQASLRWGLRTVARVTAPGQGGALTWARLRQALLGGGAVDTGVDPSAEAAIAEVVADSAARRAV